ncbi:MAG: hypothetical protein OXH64_02335 [Rhodospirillaceae bacterium]|nr:hypothetical protein [Rhodospirillaceae bacterium]
MSAPRADLHFPDRGDRTEKRVDVCVRIGEKRYVLEHTRIDPFENAVGIGKAFSDFVTPIEDRFSSTLPGPAHYGLTLPLDHRFEKRLLTRAQEEIIDWVSVEAKRLYEKARASKFLTKPTTTAREFPGLIPYSVRLSCTLMGEPSDNATGQFYAVRATDTDLEKQRFKRLCRAFTDKFPKLEQCKDRGARTILVLENNDNFLSNSVTIRESLNRAAEERTDLPDEIYLVWAPPKTATWYLFPMNPAADSLFLPDFDVECKALESADLKDLMREECPEFQCRFCGVSP